ncbi:F-box domain-containing protein [Mycena sanguinolenta]|uniref:F-box domain-containing protein n=1 Tax=Mycena sanguinolenta TaxID=230812 RepID=A0A8H6YU45_9AGAR|nr:F-box domain-containing protein [Mycena sanguinolenta]
MSSLCSACGAVAISMSDTRITSDLQLPAGFLKNSATNEPPGEAQSSLMGPFIDETSSRLAILDAEILRLQGRLRQLQEERTVLLTYHAQALCILCPLRRIPPEILSEIFAWTLPFRREVLSTENCPWVLTHVCRGWRAVAITTSSLWSRIYIDFSISQWYPLEMIKTQLERARALKVHFFASQDDDSGAPITLFALLAEHSARWTHLSMQLTSHLLPQAAALDLRSLSRAWVQWDTEDSQPAGIDSIDLFRTATSLVDIGVYSEFRFLRTHIPAPHLLTRYEFDGPWEAHCELLKSLPNLQEVRVLRYFDQDEDWPDLAEPMDLPYVRRLYVDDPACLDYLKAPNLEEIAIWTADTDSMDASILLEHFLVRSGVLPPPPLHTRPAKCALDGSDVGKVSLPHRNCHDR